MDREQYEELIYHFECIIEILNSCDKCRDISIAITKLEEMRLWIDKDW